MGHAEPKPWTLDEFLTWERGQSERYEYVCGVVRMMTGGTNDHRTIMLNLGAWLRDRVRPLGCRAFVEGPKVLADEQSAYPDVSVVCGEVRPKDDCVTDAVLIAEILSPTTEGYDRGAKWRLYQNLPSLRHYLLISQDGCAVDLYTREGDGWRPLRFGALDQSLPLTALDLELPLADLYEDSSVASTPSER